MDVVVARLQERDGRGGGLDVGRWLVGGADGAVSVGG